MKAKLLSLSPSRLRKATIAYLIMSKTGHAFSNLSIEVEQKFTMTHGTQVLEDLGFVSLGREKAMTDWYFDDATFSLLRQDCWLRLRALGSVADAISEGTWQLKVGDGSGSVTTVYTEIEGSAAVSDALSSKLKDYAKELPKLPGDLREIDVDDTSIGVSDPSKLVAFARIGTHRASWRMIDKQFNGINIDLDSTDFGYAIGEVEIEVDAHELVPIARQRIQEVIGVVSGPKTAEEKPMGKLEFYLSRRRPDIHSICVEHGVI